MYGLLKENGPYLVDAEERPFSGLHLVKNKQSWHKVANIIYIDNPAGTGFSYNINPRTSWELSQDEITKELTEFLVQFLKLLPYYTNSNGVPKMYIFGESYGGTYVVSLGEHIVSQGLAKVIYFMIFVLSQ